MITWQMFRDRWNREKVYTRPEFWDDAAEKYYREAGTNVWVNPHLNAHFHDTESAILHGWVKDPAGMRILDLGCGAGRFAREFAKRGAKVDALDFSAKSIEIARKLTSDPNVNYSVGSVYDLEADGVYDVVICAKVLSIACKDRDDLMACLGKIRRALKPGGRLLSIELCHTTFVRRVLSMRFADYKSAVREAGFNVLDTKVTAFIPARMALAFFEFPRWVTVTGLKTGEAIVKVLPATSDTKFLLAEKR